MWWPSGLGKGDVWAQEMALEAVGRVWRMFPENIRQSRREVPLSRPPQAYAAFKDSHSIELSYPDLSCCMTL